MEKPLNIQQASEFTGYAVNTLYQMTKKNKVPHHKIARKLFFYASELDAWIKGKTKTEENK